MATRKKPADFDELYPGRFIKAVDFKDKPVTLTMSDVSQEELEGEKGPEVKTIISFRETPKEHVACKTNGLCIKAMFGRKLSDWIGKRVTLFPGTWNGEPAIRVFGSPDLEADMVVTIALPRRKPFDMPLKKTSTARRREPGED